MKQLKFIQDNYFKNSLFFNPSNFSDSQKIKSTKLKYNSSNRILLVPLQFTDT